jgi:hypothetical protein
MKEFSGGKWRKITAVAGLIGFGSMGAGVTGMPPPAALGQIGPRAPDYSCSIKVPEPEPVDLTALAKISADEAIATALAAYPGSRAMEMALENVNGCLVYNVLLSNGLEVKVDAGNGLLLRADSEDDEDY